MTMLLRICVILVVVLGLADYAKSHPHDNEKKCPAKQCLTDSGECIPKGKKVVKECNVYQCRHRRKDDVYIYKAIKYGCMHEGKCVDRNKKWDDPDKCTKYHCKVVRRKNKDTGGISIAVGLKQTSYGCPYNGTCKSFGDKWNDESKCRSYKCSRLRNKIQIPGLRSVFHRLRTKIYGCRYGGECKSHKAQWNVTELCEEYTCIARRRKLKDGTFSYFSKVKVFKYGCSFQGSCRKKNEEWMDGCNRRKCLIVSRSSITDIIKPGCMDNNNTCHEENSTWIEKCITVQCVVKKIDRNTYSMTNKNIGFECMDADGKCRKMDETGYPMIIKGKRYENCNCTLTTKPDGTYSIGKSCSGGTKM